MDQPNLNKRYVTAILRENRFLTVALEVCIYVSWQNFCCVYWLSQDGATHTLKEWIVLKEISWQEASIFGCTKKGWPGKGKQLLQSVDWTHEIVIVFTGFVLQTATP